MSDSSAVTPPSAATLLQADQTLRDWNTFGLDARARYAAVIETEDALPAVLADPRVSGLPVLIWGGGSNIVLTRDIDALVLRIALRGRRILRADPEGDVACDGVILVEAAAGEPWHAFVEWTLAQGCPGLENLAAIPGTVGAAPIQNIGAYGLEMAEYFAHLRAYDRITGEIRVFDRDACAFGYRDSVFKGTEAGRWIVLSVTFALPRRWTPRRSYADLDRALAEKHLTSAPAARDIFDAVVSVRAAKLPDPAKVGNAGSFFKNPVVEAAHHAMLRDREPDLVAYPQADGRYKLAAGWMIDRCGWKGRALDGAPQARVHDRQALVLTNAGGASGAQIVALASRVADDVEARYGVRLEVEPSIL